MDERHEAPYPDAPCMRCHGRCCDAGACESARRNKEERFALTSATEQTHRTDCGGSLAAGAAHHRSCRGRVGCCRAHRQGRARRRYSKWQWRRTGRLAHCDARHARQHSQDDGARGRTAPLGSEPSCRRSRKLTRRRGVGGRRRPTRTRQPAGRGLPRHSSGLDAAWHADRRARADYGTSGCGNCAAPRASSAADR